MRFIVIALALCTSTACWAAPIKYIFSGYTTSITASDGNRNPNLPIAREDGAFVTNGDSKISGELVFDPSAWRDGAGGSGWGEVISWTCATEGLAYFGAGGAFHYLEFEDNSFSYLDEVPEGGYGPDVAGINLDFSNEPFADGLAHFPVEQFLGGTFFTSVEDGWISDTQTMWGVRGIITELSVAPVAVPTPSSISLLLGGLGLIIGLQIKRSSTGSRKVS